MREGYEFVETIKKYATITPGNVKEYGDKVYNNKLEEFKNNWFTNNILPAAKETSFYKSSFSQVRSIDDLLDIRPVSMNDLQSNLKQSINPNTNIVLNVNTSSGKKINPLSAYDLNNLAMDYDILLYLGGVNPGERLLGVTAPQTTDKLYASSFGVELITETYKTRTTRLELGDMTNIRSILSKIIQPRHQAVLGLSNFVVNIAKLEGGKAFVKKIIANRLKDTTFLTGGDFMPKTEKELIEKMTGKWPVNATGSADTTSTYINHLENGRVTHKNGMHELSAITHYITLSDSLEMDNKPEFKPRIITQRATSFDEIYEPAFTVNNIGMPKVLTLLGDLYKRVDVECNLDLPSFEIVGRKGKPVNHPKTREEVWSLGYIKVAGAPVIASEIETAIKEDFKVNNVMIELDNRNSKPVLKFTVGYLLDKPSEEKLLDNFIKAGIRAENQLNFPLVYTYNTGKIGLEFEIEKIDKVESAKKLQNFLAGKITTADLKKTGILVSKDHYKRNLEL